MTTHLFMTTTTRDDVQVGWSGDDRDSALESLEGALVASETTLLWHYAVERGESGLQVPSVRKVALFRGAIIRAEAVSTDPPIVAPPG